MEKYRDIYAWQPPETGCAIALGRFDGVHLGHRALLVRAVERARSLDLLPVCFSFQESTYPASKERGQLTTDEEKAGILAEIGLEVLLHPAFSPPLTDMSAGDFVGDLITGRWGAKLIVAGFDFHFGRDRMGDVRLLKDEGEKGGAVVEIFEPFSIEGEVVKATSIREMIQAGQIQNASNLLGRPYSITAKKQEGRRLGTKLGFPTVNFAWPGLKVRPPLGVYAVVMQPEIAGSSGLKGVANFGLRPTTDPSNEVPLVEVHILEFLQPDSVDPDDFPTDTLFRIEFLKFLRREEKFGSVDELKEQIANDCRNAEEFHRISQTGN